MKKISQFQVPPSTQLGPQEEDGPTQPTQADFWQRCLERLALEIPPQQFSSWIKGLQANYQPEQARMRLQVSNRVALEHIRKNYLGTIGAVAQEVSGAPLNIQIGLAARAGHGGAASAGTALPHRARSAPAVAGIAGLAQHVQAQASQQRPDQPVQATLQQQAMPQAQALPEMELPLMEEELLPLAEEAPPAGDEGVAPPAAGAASGPGSAGGARAAHLKPQLTFDNLIEGSANRMARAAALHVAHAPGQMYNPLFIYGGVGLGKTHLIHAVGNQMLAARPDAKVLYIHAEQFVTDVVRSYQRKTFDALKQRYHSLDLLLIDDVQFIAGKERTQEEFFNAFEALLSKKSHIVMTSDTYPKGLMDIHERLVSRFDQGLTVAIEPPELEMRVAILINKARAEGIALSEDVAFFIAKSVRSNVRELEGALHKVLAYARFSGKEISIAVVREALRDLLSIQNRQISVENIQKTVADFYKIKVTDMLSKKRPASIAKPRQIAMYLAKELTQKSLPEIGEMFGRDHTTVLHAVNKVRLERQQQTELNQQLHVLEQTLKR
ncbi:chromosomal replication initiator protein DnaA [Vandammella animalimorsus]|uniref:Chromosomal replication initiator protein DnaA n=1 Tax=Vandammella animalimorsus TaxID=2029117 RepID=A0A2A2T6Z9_9BURK|nr:chromosomal replication initiator protein DnaA [Vandammella animalimorsus]PAX17492.1 chromosomal replication initiator protein DnaA [Vandammella animalimorsus]PAX19545.1 chromosomal replication initiator protein DnaA [Vandammella animalimorsus]